MLTHNGYVHYGCGLKAPESWTNFDASPTPRLQKIPVVGTVVSRSRPTFPAGIHFGDIVKGLPIEPGSCEAIYCSHVLEHLSLNDFRIALANTLGGLKPKGIFRCVLPDLEALARAYLASDSDRPAEWFMRNTYLGFENRPKGLAGMAREWLGNSRHLWMWDERTLSTELRAAGFTEIRRASFGDSAEPKFAEVEEISRWTGCLGIECRRPSV